MMSHQNVTTFGFGQTNCSLVFGGYWVDTHSRTLAETELIVAGEEFAFQTLAELSC